MTPAPLSPSPEPRPDDIRGFRLTPDALVEELKAARTHAGTRGGMMAIDSLGLHIEALEAELAVRDAVSRREPPSDGRSLEEKERDTERHEWVTRDTLEKLHRAEVQLEEIADAAGYDRSILSAPCNALAHNIKMALENSARGWAEVERLAALPRSPSAMSSPSEPTLVHAENCPCGEIEPDLEKAHKWRVVAVRAEQIIRGAPSEAAFDAARTAFNRAIVEWHWDMAFRIALTVAYGVDGVASVLEKRPVAEVAGGDTDSRAATDGQAVRGHDAPPPAGSQRGVASVGTQPPEPSVTEIANAAYAYLHAQTVVGVPEDTLHRLHARLSQLIAPHVVHQAVEAVRGPSSPQTGAPQ